MTDRPPIYYVTRFIVRAAVIAALFYAPVVAAQIAGGSPW